MATPRLTYNSHGSMMALGLTLMCLAVLAMAIRVISNRKYSKRIDIHDMLIVPAFVLTLGLGITVVAATSMHIIGGQELPTMGEREFQRINQLEWGFWIAYVLAVGSIKLSILFFFRTLFRGHAYRSPFDYCNWFLIIITSAWTVTFTFAVIFICGIDPAALWETSFWIEQKCVNTYALFLACAVTNFIIDLGIVIEPLAVVSKLHMNFRRKLQASLIFLISVFAVVAGLMRMIFWIQANDGQHSRLVYHEVGLTYPISDLEPLVTICIFWTYLEVGVGFIVACLLPSAKLLDAFLSTSAVNKIRSLSSILSSRSKESIHSGSTAEGKEFDFNARPLPSIAVSEPESIYKT